MINKIKSIFKKKDIIKYSINHITCETRELFYIKKDLSMVRENYENSYILTVFKKFKKDDVEMLGKSEVIVSDAMSDEELSKIIDDAYFSAGFVLNTFYETPSHIKGECFEDSFENKPLSECANIMADALFKNDINEDVFINSAEIFVKRYREHIVTSDDIDVAFSMCVTNGEYVCQKKEPVDVETYTSFSYLTLDTDGLAKKVKESLNNTRLRSEADGKIASGNYDVMLTGENVFDFFSYFTAKASAITIVNKISDYKIGTNVQGNSIKKDKLNINLIPFEPFSSEGIKMIERPFIEDGVVKTIHGDSKNCYKLNIEPTGYYSRISVKPGADNNTPDKYLEAILFSSFQMDESSGFFGGELRLGIYHDGDKSYPVTGCTISGNVSQVCNNIKLSKDTQSFLDYNGPKNIILENLSVTGNIQ